jgi:hypothetical protein
MSVSMNVDSCSMEPTPQVEHGVLVTFAHKSEKYAKSKNTSKIRNSVIYERISMRFEVFESTRRAALDGYDVSVTGSGTNILMFEKPYLGRPSSDFDETGCFRGS